MISFWIHPVPKVPNTQSLLQSFLSVSLIRRIMYPCNTVYRGQSVHVKSFLLFVFLLIFVIPGRYFCFVCCIHSLFCLICYICLVWYIILVLSYMYNILVVMTLYNLCHVRFIFFSFLMYNVCFPRYI